MWPSDCGTLEGDGRQVSAEGWDGCYLDAVEIFLDAAEGDKRLEHVDKGLGKGVERKLHFGEDYVRRK